MDAAAIQNLLRAGVAHCAAQRFNDGERNFRQVLAAAPDCGEGCHYLGMLLDQLGRLDEAMPLLKRAAQLQPRTSAIWCSLGECLRKIGDFDAAAEALSRAIEIDPNFVDAHNAMGVVRANQKRLEEAVAAFQETVRLSPEHGQAWSNLGNTFCALKQFPEAMAAHRQALRWSPSSPTIQNNLGATLREMGDFAQAAEAFTRAAALQPGFEVAHVNLANTLRTLGRYDQALAAAQSAVRCPSPLTDAYGVLGLCLRDAGRLEESIAAHRRALELSPKSAMAYNNLGGVLASAGKLDEALKYIQQAMEVDPQHPNQARIQSNRIYMLNFHPGYDGPAILAQHVEWARQFAQPLAAQIAPHPNVRDPERCLRVGYLSPDFRAHPVGRFVLPLLENHDHERFEIVGFSSVSRIDDTTRRCQAACDRWHNVLSLNDAQIAQKIREEEIDVLLDLTLHMTNNHMLVFARKPVPVQASWLGYAGTTGLGTMDYRISDPHLDPPGLFDGHYAEKTVLLPRTYWCYEPPACTPEVGPSPVCMTRTIAFGCLNNFWKVTQPTQDLWARLLLAVEDSRLLIHAKSGSHIDEARRRFERAGVDSSRVEFLPYRAIDAYLAQYQQIDIALDPIPYGGGTTTCDALWMGVPVVTLAGNTAVGRAGVTLLTNVGLSELIASSPDDYIAIASRLACDRPRLAELRKTLRERMRSSPLMDAKQFAADMEGLYRQMWRTWCEATG